jgi:hypothetical protein
LNGTVFEVDATLVGETVTLRFDPAVPASRGIQVCKDNAFVGIAKPVDAYANCFVRRNRPSRNIDLLPGTAPTNSATAATAPSRAAPVAPSRLHLHALLKLSAPPLANAPSTLGSAQDRTHGVNTPATDTRLTPDEQSTNH